MNAYTESIYEQSSETKVLLYGNVSWGTLSMHYDLLLWYTEYHTAKNMFFVVGDE